jgi:glutamine synthetase, type I
MVDKVDSVKKAVDTLKSNDIKWVHSAFVDIRGILQDMVLPAREYLSGNAFTAGIGFDGSSVRGFKSIEESDMIFMPDAKTLSIMPWETDPVQKSAIVLGDVYEGNGGKEASVVDPRSYVAKRAVEEAAKMGYTSFFAPELEFFVFKSIDPTKLTYDLWVSPKGGEGDSWGAPRVVPESPEVTPGGYIIRPKEAYYRTPPEDTTVAFRNEASQVMDEYFGIEIEKHHHEVATVGQVEIDYKYGPLLDTADRALLYKFVAKNIAKKHGLIATFMPKPVYLDNASGMHCHQSIWSKGKTCMYDEKDTYAELSQIGRYYVGGLLEHAKALTAICCPTVSSYKRLVPGFEAPIYVMWSRRNRSALARIPLYYKGPEFAAQKRVEYRGVDPSCNPYLAFSALLMAGLDGIKKKIDPGDPCDEDLYKLTPQKRRSLGIKELPTTLKDALDELESDEVMKNALGSHIFDAFIELKTKDWNQYCLYVSPWEIMKYLDY